MSTAEKTLSDFEYSAVPMDKRRSFTTITIIWTGFVFVITSMMAGGGLAAGMAFKDIVGATVIGNVFLSIIGILVSVIACRTGLTFALLTRYTFGRRGSRVASLIVPLVNIGWYTIQSAVFGHFIALILGVDGGALELAIMALSAVVMGIFAYYGVNALGILGYIAIPAIIYLSLFTAAKSVIVAGGFDKIAAYLPTDQINMTTGITIVIGTWILTAATSIADIMRYAKSTTQAALSALVGLVLGNTLMILTAAVAAIAMGESDLTALLLGMGLVVPSLILMTTNIFTTNAANLYSVSLNLSNAFNMDRRKLIAIVLVVSAVLTLFRPHEVGVLFMLLDVSGMVIPPLAGVLLADYYIVHRAHYEPLDTAILKNWKIASWVTWAAASALVYLVHYTAGFGLPSVNGIVFSLVLYPVFNALLDRVPAVQASKERI